MTFEDILKFFHRHDYSKQSEEVVNNLTNCSMIIKSTKTCKCGDSISTIRHEKNIHTMNWQPAFDEKWCTNYADGTKVPFSVRLQRGTCKNCGFEQQRQLAGKQI